MKLKLKRLNEEENRQIILEDFNEMKQKNKEKLLTLDIINMFSGVFSL